MIRNLGVFSLVIALLGGCAAQGQPQASEETWFDECAPGTPGVSSAGESPQRDIELPCFTGGAAAAIKGPAIVNLWASWCEPCRHELPAFQRLADSGRVPVVGVVTLDDRSRALSTAKDLGVRFATFYDPGGKIQKSTGKALLPITLFVNSDGKITHTHTGAPLNDATLDTLVKELVP